MKSPGSNVREEGLALVKQAAEGGHLEAQAFYGRTRFTDLMTTGAESSLQPDYVEAVFYLSLAARRGSAEAADTVPQLASLSVGSDGAFSEELALPLSLLEESWVRGALERAQRALTCFEK